MLKANYKEYDLNVVISAVQNQMEKLKKASGFTDEQLEVLKKIILVNPTGYTEKAAPAVISLKVIIAEQILDIPGGNELENAIKYCQAVYIYDELKKAKAWAKCKIFTEDYADLDDILPLRAERYYVETLYVFAAEYENDELEPLVAISAEVECLNTYSIKVSEGKIFPRWEN